MTDHVTPVTSAGTRSGEPQRLGELLTPWTARVAGFPQPDPAAAPCYGRTNGGTACQLPAGHYPDTKHLVAMGESWMAWTDESMAEFARAANDTFNADHPDHEERP